jgi:hypothetical protein
MTDRFKNTPDADLPLPLQWGRQHERDGVLAGVHAEKYSTAHLSRNEATMELKTRVVVPTILATGGELSHFDCPSTCTCGWRSAKKAGLLIHKLLSWMGASPDALVLDPSDPRGVFGALEIKCPFSCKDTTPYDWKTTKTAKKSSLVPLLGKRTAPYRQIQWILTVLRSWSAREVLSFLGMDISEVLQRAGLQVPANIDSIRFEWADLVVWTPQGTHVERIYYDTAWWEQQARQVRRVYLNAVLPEYAAQRRPYAPVRGYSLDKGREVVVDKEQRWLPEFELDSEGDLVRTCGDCRKRIDELGPHEWESQTDLPTWCDNCGVAYHCVCAGFTDEDGHLPHWTCPSCNQSEEKG